MLSITEKENHLFIEAIGPIKYSMLIPFIDQLIKNEKHLEMNNIWYFNRTTVEIKLVEFWKIIQHIKRIHPITVSHTRVAIITTTYFEKALAQIWVNYAKGIPFESKSFDNLIDATLWIEKKSLPNNY